MTESPSLKDLLVVDAAVAGRMLEAAGAEGSPVRQAARLLAPLLGNRAPALAEKVNAVLDLPVARLLARAWSHYSELSRYADVEQYPPEREVEIGLGDHSVRSVHRPYVEVSVKGVAAGLRIELEVELVAEVTDAALEVRAGAVERIRGGTVSCRATLSCWGREVAPAARRSFALPEVAFAEPIPIRKVPPILRVGSASG